MKKRFILFLLPLCLLLGALSGCKITYNEPIISYNHASKYTTGEGQTLSTVTAVDIDWVNGDINVTGGEGDALTFTEQVFRTLQDEEIMRWWLEDTTLHIRYAKSGYRSKSAPNKTLFVTLPKNCSLQELDAKGVSSNVKIENLTAAKIDVESHNGVIRLENVKASTEIKTQIVYGITEIVCTLVPCAKINAECVSGDIIITLPLNASFVASLQSQKGSCSCAFADLEEKNKIYSCAVSEGAAVESLANPPCRIEAQCVSGRAIIKKP